MWEKRESLRASNDKDFSQSLEMTIQGRGSFNIIFYRYGDPSSTFVAPLLQGAAQLSYKSAAPSATDRDHTIRMPLSPHQKASFHRE